MVIIIVLAILGVIVLISIISRSRSPVSKDASMEVMKQLLMQASQQPSSIPPDYGRNHPDYILGNTFESNGDYEKASSCYRKAAEEGCAAAQHDLGVLFLAGRGVPQNYSEAANWFRKAAEQGVPDSQANLGLQYVQGLGVTKDPVEAVKWFRKSAAQCFPDGMFKLGAMYANGEGVPQDFKEALRLINLAADMGHPEAKVERELVARKAFFAGALD